MAKVTVSAVFSKLSRLVDSVGVEMVLNKLDEIDTTSSGDSLEEFIICLCCEEFSVDRSKVLTPNYVNAQCVTARDMIVVLLDKHLLDKSQQDIARICKKKKSMVTRVLKDFKQLQPKLIHHKVFLDKFAALNEQIEQHKLNQKN